MSNGYNDTSMGDEQIKPVVSFSSTRSWMEPPRESWTGAGGRIGDEEDRGRGQHAGDDTEG